MLGPLYSKTHIRESLSREASAPHDDMLWLAGAPAHVLEQVRASLPTHPVPAAVLVPLVEREEGLTVLLTQRAATLKDHAGQISFPGGRIEPEDADAWRAALREAHEEIDKLRKLIQSEFGSVMEFFVHSDGCIPACCPVCIKTDCHVREHPFIKKIEWEMQNVIPNKKHDVNTPF